MDYHIMKRRELQALCKKHNIPANSANSVLADKLSELLNGKQKPCAQQPTCIKSSVETTNEGEPAVRKRHAKKVRFSPDNDLVEYEPGKKQMAMVTNTRGQRKSVAKKVEQSVIDDSSAVELIENVSQTSVKLIRSKVQGKQAIKDVEKGTDVVKGAGGNLGKITRSKAHTLAKGGVDENKPRKRAVKVVENASESVDETVIDHVRVTRSKAEPKRSGKQVAKDVRTVEQSEGTNVVKGTESNLGKVTRSKAHTLAKGGVDENKPRKRAVKDVGNGSESVDEIVIDRVRVTRSKAETKRSGKQVAKDVGTVEQSEESMDIPVRVTRSRGQTSNEGIRDTANDPSYVKKRTRREMKLTDTSKNMSNVAPEDNQKLPKRKSMRIRGVKNMDEDEIDKVEVVNESRVSRLKSLATESSGNNKSKIENKFEEPLKHAGKKNVTRRKSVVQVEKTELDLHLEEPVKLDEELVKLDEEPVKLDEEPVKRRTRNSIVKEQSKEQSDEVKENVTRSREDASENERKAVSNVKRRTRNSIVKEQSTEQSDEVKENVTRSREDASENERKAVSNVKRRTRNSIVKEQSKEQSDEVKENVTRSREDAFENERKAVSNASGSLKSRKRRGIVVIEDQTVEAEFVSPVDESSNRSVRSVNKREGKVVAGKQLESSLKTPASRKNAVTRDNSSTKRLKLSGMKPSDSMDNTVKSNEDGSPVSENGNFELGVKVVEPKVTPAIDESRRRFTRSAIRSEIKKSSELAIEGQAQLSSHEVAKFRADPVFSTAPGRITRSGIKVGRNSASNFTERTDKNKRTSRSTHKRERFDDDAQISSPEVAEIRPNPDVTVALSEIWLNPGMTTEPQSELMPNPVVPIEVQSEIRLNTDVNVEFQSENRLNPDLAVESQFDIRPDPDLAVESQFEFRPLADVTIESESEFRPFPDATVVSQSEIKPTPDITVESRSKIRPSPDVTLESRSEIRPSPDVTLESQSKFRLSPDVTLESQSEIRQESQPGIWHSSDVPVESQPEIRPSPDVESPFEIRPNPDGTVESHSEVGPHPDDTIESQSELMPNPEVTVESQCEVRPNPDENIEPQSELRPNPDVIVEFQYEISEERTVQILEKTADLAALESVRFLTEDIKENRDSGNVAAVVMETVSPFSRQNQDSHEISNGSFARAKDFGETPSGESIFNVKRAPFLMAEFAETVPDAISDGSTMQNQNVDVKSSLFGEDEVQVAVNIQKSVLISGRPEADENVSVDNLLEDEENKRDSVSYDVGSSAAFYLSFEQSDVKSKTKEVEVPDENIKEHASEVLQSTGDDVIKIPVLGKSDGEDEKCETEVSAPHIVLEDPVLSGGVDIHEMDSVVGEYDAEPKNYDSLNQSAGNDKFFGKSNGEDEKCETEVSTPHIVLEDPVLSGGVDIREMDSVVVEYDAEPKSYDSLNQSAGDDKFFGKSDAEDEKCETEVSTPRIVIEDPALIGGVDIREMDSVVGDYDAEPKNYDSLNHTAGDDKFFQGLPLDKCDTIYDQESNLKPVAGGNVEEADVVQDQHENMPVLTEVLVNSDLSTSKEAQTNPATSGNDGAEIACDAQEEFILDINKDAVISDGFENTANFTDTKSYSGNQEKITVLQSNESESVSKESESVSLDVYHALSDKEEQKAAPVDHDWDSGNFIEDDSNLGLDHEHPTREECNPVPFEDDSNLGLDHDHPTREEYLPKEDDITKQEENRNTSTYVDWGDYNFRVDEYQRPVSANESDDALAESEKDDHVSDIQSVKNVDADSRIVADEKSNQDEDLLKGNANADLSEEIFNWPDSSMKSLFTPSASRTGHLKHGQDDAVNFAREDHFADSSLKTLFATPATTQISHLKDVEADTVTFAFSEGGCNEDIGSKRTPTHEFNNNQLEIELSNDYNRENEMYGGANFEDYSRKYFEDEEAGGSSDLSAKNKPFELLDDNNKADEIKQYDLSGEAAGTSQDLKDNTIHSADFDRGRA